METIAFIGMGNMARAIAQGFLAGGAVQVERLRAYAPHFDKLEAFCRPLGIHAARSTEEALEGADTVVMAVKPYVLPEVVARYGEALQGKAILSVVAGVTHAKYLELLGPNARAQYIMPNTPASVGEGMLLFEQEHSLTEAEHAEALRLFSALGRVMELPTHLMGAGMAISGCGPAFVAMMVEALADAGVMYGLPRAAALTLAAQTALGTGKMLLESGLHPGQLKDGVCSPGGTTIRGVAALEAHGARNAFIQAVKATLEKP